MSKIRIVCVVIVILIFLPQVSIATPPGDTCVYGVKIHLLNDIELNGYIESDWPLISCKEKTDDFEKNYEHVTWESFLERQRDDIDSGRRTIDTVRFISKLIEIKYNKTYSKYMGIENYGMPWLVAAKSSIKKVKIKDIRRIEGVCRKWDGSHTWTGVIIITDYIAEYISNHKMIASYIFDHEGVPSSDEEYAFGQCTSYLSYNPDYPRERLMKQRKIIDKMPEEILDKNKLIRFRWAYD